MQTMHVEQERCRTINESHCVVRNMLNQMGSFLLTWAARDPKLACVCCGRSGARCLLFMFVERAAELSFLCCRECELAIKE